MRSNTISVIIPCYNSEKTIERAILSVKQQTYKKIEIICIDDGSTDRTIDILTSLSLKSNNLTILKNSRNSGPSYSRNKGVSISKGQYIAFLDSDDYWHPQLLELQFNFLIKYSFDLISSPKTIDLKKERRIDPLSLKLKKISFTKLLFKNYFTTSSILMRKIIFKNFDESQKYSEDYKLWLEIVSDKNNRTAIISNHALVGSDKSSYGISGLSANLWLMEKYEIKNYLYFLKKGHILTLLAIPISLIKYFKRLCLTLLRKRQLP